MFLPDQLYLTTQRKRGTILEMHSRYQNWLTWLGQHHQIPLLYFLIREMDFLWQNGCELPTKFGNIMGCIITVPFFPIYSEKEDLFWGSPSPHVELPKNEHFGTFRMILKKTRGKILVNRSWETCDLKFPDICQVSKVEKRYFSSCLESSPKLPSTQLKAFVYGCVSKQLDPKIHLHFFTGNYWTWGSNFEIREATGHRWWH